MLPFLTSVPLIHRCYSSHPPRQVSRYVSPLPLPLSSSPHACLTAQFIPLSVSTSISSVGVGFIMRSTGHYWRTLLLCCLFSVVSMVYIATWDQTTTGAVAPFGALLMLGAGAVSWVHEVTQ